MDGSNESEAFMRTNPFSFIVVCALPRELAGEETVPGTPAASGNRLAGLRLGEPPGRGTFLCVTAEMFLKVLNWLPIQSSSER